MRYKVAPPARSLEFLGEARGAVPLVPDDEADCCRAIQRATDITDRERAREYLTFLRALGLVAESERGYYRTQDDFDPEALATACRERVFLVAELLETVDTSPRTVEEAFEGIREEVPRWERERHADWEGVWQTRVGHLLSWAVLFGLCTVENGRFERTQ